MNKNISIDKTSQIPVYKQIVMIISSMIDSGELKQGEMLPSMNELAEEYEISKETVKKAYTILRDKGLLEPHQGKGFFIKNDVETHKLKVLAIFDKLSTYKQILFNSMTERLDNHAEITILLHEQNVETMEYFLNENLDNFDYYVIAPHFPHDAATQEKVRTLLKKVPNRKLIMTDNWIKSIHGDYGAVYQDWENDIIQGLGEGLDRFKNYNRLNVITLPSSLYARTIRTGVEKFCKDNDICVTYSDVVISENVRKGEAYLLLSGQYDFGLIELARLAKKKGLAVGKDIAIISYNESPISEIILNGLTTVSTDFIQMGQLIGDMILKRQLKKVHCDFRMTRRESF